MKILVTGSYGQLGTEISKRINNFPDLQFFLTDIDDLDITNESEVQNYFIKNNPDFVINCAAFTAVDKAESEKESAEKINAYAPEILGKYSHRSGAKIIHISTDYVFDGKGFVPYSESDNVNPQNIYGITKLQGEINIQRENPKSVIIRTSWLYSSNGNNFVKTILRIGNERDKINVVFDQVGTPTYAGDLADVILRIIYRSNKDSKNFVPGVYHFSNEGVISWFDFAKAIFELSGIKCKISPVLSAEFPTPAKRPNYSVLNKSKIKDIFKLEIPYWKDSLQICLQELKRI